MINEYYVLLLLSVVSTNGLYLISKIVAKVSDGQRSPFSLSPYIILVRMR